MTGLALALVLGSGFLHSVWNLYTKKSINKNVFLWFTQLMGFLIFLPWTMMEWDSSRLSGPGLWFLLASVVLHGLYIVLLAAAYTIGDLSQVYPIMRGTSPLLVPLLAVIFLHERLSAAGWLGVIAIVLGIVFMSDMNFRRSRQAPVSYKAPLMALAVGGCIASYIIVDKLALSYVSPVVLIEATNIGNMLALSWLVLKSGGIRLELNSNWKSITLGGLIAPGGYLLFLFASSLAPVAQLAPMREIGTVFGTFMGIFILREKQGVRRIFISLLITLGVIVLGLWG
ncbi:DMT family transporter [Paenibacillus sp. JCM 10914]|uniref:DMT family transporter n=1 Tax=Paenibacillus sp. JCM 10914 TaxID=1236974 RepID=UPI0003CC7EB4|nr:DMT family transporter [Paenibacillus sp. JCM 10914]GAE07138.1 integral membrane protein [Paenibacillus sp. JCM 10914]